MPAFFTSLEKIKPLFDWTHRIILFICKILLIADIIITTWAVAGRYIPFITDPKWSEEIVLTLMVYMAVLSATLAIRKRSHIRPDCRYRSAGAGRGPGNLRNQVLQFPAEHPRKVCGDSHAEQVLAVPADPGGGRRHGDL